MPRTLEARVHQASATAGQGTVRTHHIVIDRPVEKGGTDRGPLGGELLLLSLGGCFLSTLLAAVGSRSAEVSNIHIAVTATIDGTPERIEAMELRIRARYSDDEMMRKLVGIAERGCLVTNTLKAALVITIVLERED